MKFAAAEDDTGNCGRRRLRPNMATEKPNGRNPSKTSIGVAEIERDRRERDGQYRKAKRKVLVDKRAIKSRSQDGVVRGGGGVAPP